MNRKEEYLSGCVVLDTETTNIDKEKAEIIELGIAISDGKKWDSRSDLYKPKIMPIDPEISAVTNIVDSMVMDKPHFQDRVELDLNPIMGFARDNNGTLLAHNAPYDYTVVNNYVGVIKINTPWVCTMRIAKHLFSSDETVKKYNLPYLRYRFKLDIPDNLEHHRASADAYITGKLFEHFVDVMIERGMLDDSYPYKSQIDAIAAKPIFIHRVPFGKHMNESWDKVPKSYMNWAINNLTCLNDTDPLYDSDLAHTFETVMSKLLENGDI